MPKDSGVRSAAGVHQPDTLDNRIIRELGSPRSFQQWNVRESYSSIARRLGVDEETVRRRIKRAEKAGAIQGWRAVIHPHTIGLVDVFLDVDVNDVARKDVILSQLRLLDSIVVITNFEGPGLFVLLYSEPGDAMSRRAELIRTICGADRFDLFSSILPPCDLQLSRTDWQIVWAMRDDPRKSISHIARDARVTPRTVNRRLTLLTERRAFFLMGLPSFRSVAGTTASFLISQKEGGRISSVAQKIASKFQDVTFQAVAPSGMMCNIFFHNLPEAEDAYDWIKKLEDVGAARMRVMRDLVLVREWLDGEMKKRLSERV